MASAARQIQTSDNQNNVDLESPTSIDCNCSSASAPDSLRVTGDGNWSINTCRRVIDAGTSYGERSSESRSQGTQFVVDLPLKQDLCAVLFTGVVEDMDLHYVQEDNTTGWHYRCDGGDCPLCLIDWQVHRFILLPVLNLIENCPYSLPIMVSSEPRSLFSQLWGLIAEVGRTEVYQLVTIKQAGPHEFYVRHRPFAESEWRATWPLRSHIDDYHSGQHDLCADLYGYASLQELLSYPQVATELRRRGIVS